MSLRTKLSYTVLTASIPLLKLDYFHDSFLDIHKLTVTESCT